MRATGLPAASVPVSVPGSSAILLGQFTTRTSWTDPPDVPGVVCESEGEPARVSDGVLGEELALLAIDSWTSPVASAMRSAYLSGNADRWTACARSPGDILGSVSLYF